jgi:adenylate kinase family enzyme
VNLPNHPQSIGERISVVGTTGVGKTTVARQLSQWLGYPHIELDALFWESDWQEVPETVFQARVQEAIRQDRWVLDGNYSRIRNLVWNRADTVVYLDYSFLRIFWQLITRTIQRAVRKEVLWHNNRENLQKSFFSKDSILYWMIRTYHRQRRQHQDIFQQSLSKQLRIIHLQTPQQTKGRLSEIPQFSGRSEARIECDV